VNHLKYRRQFLLTTEPITNLNDWKKRTLNKHTLYSHPDLTTFYLNHNKAEIVLLGHILNPYNHKETELEILKKIAISPNPIDIAKVLYSLSGRFVLLVKTENRTLFFNDACGLRSFNYSYYNGALQIASQPLLLKLAVGDLVTKKERYFSFSNSDYRKNNKENWFPSGTTLYKDVHHLAPNHYLDSETLSQHRYWPNEKYTLNDYTSSLEKFSNLLQSILIAGSEKYNLSLGITAGFDSRIILSTCKPVKENMSFYTLKYRNMNNSSRDIKVPLKLNKIMHLNHKIINCELTTEPGFAKIYEENSDMSHLDDWGQIAYGISKTFKKDMMAIKGSCSETGRCYFYKSGKHPKLNSGIDLIAYNTNWKGISFIENRLTNWFNTLKEDKTNFGYPILDLFHWEISTGSWQMQNQLEWDIVHETFTPFNNRELLDTMLRIDPKFRSRPNNYQLYQDTILKFWPEVLSQPVNPPTLKEWIKTSIKKTLAKIGVEKYNH